jgi:carbamoyltransferase
MLIVGFNAWHGDVAAAVVKDGQLVAALEEERFARVKHVAGFPTRAILAGLREAGATPRDVDVWAVARGRRAHLLRKAWFAFRHRPAAALAAQHRRRAAQWAGITETLCRELDLDIDAAARLRYVEHHPAHLASAYYASGMAEAACCAIDGFGDFVSASVGHGRGHRLDVLSRTWFPHSLGLFYLALTQYLGFKHYGDEFKVMGLAPYGRPIHADRVARLVRLTVNGGFELDLSYFRHWTGEVTMQWESGAPDVPDVYSPRLEELLGPARQPGAAVTAEHEHMAASLQHVFEQAAWHVLRGAHARVPLPDLCLAGGCAMNSVMNGKIRANTAFSRVFIQPAAGDNGTALGAALHVWFNEGAGVTPLRMTHAAWGTSWPDEAIARTIRESGIEEAGGCAWTTAADEGALCDTVADALADGAIVGWFQGRMEWGARALGHRSILADPRRADMREVINRKIKFRERFRPFAPAVLAEAVDDYFVGAVEDPFMLQVYPVRPDKRAVIPAVTHVDGSGRLMTVGAAEHPRFHRLIAAFARRTGVPVLLNTSFNENEPIVEDPVQAIDCFLRTDMDLLAMGRHVLVKAGR